MGVSPKDFWDSKILQWEENRYGAGSKQDSWLETLAKRSSGSLRFRMSMIGYLFKEHVGGKRVVELGCGSGLMAEGIIQAGAVSYLGIDISSIAVDEAKKRIEKAGLSHKASFKEGDISALSHLQGDLIFSLGLFDWLNEEQLKSVFVADPAADFLHSFAEKRNCPTQLLHRLYVHLAYGHRTGNYKPHYFRTSELVTLAERYHQGPVYVLRHKRLSFGAMITSLPLLDRISQFPY